jgi:hypothetical protein
VDEHAGSERDRQHGQSPRLTGKPDVAFAEDFPTLVLPEVLRDTSNQPEPTPFLFGGDFLIPESRQGSFEHRRAGLAALRRQESETVEKKIWTASLSFWGRCLGCRQRHLDQVRIASATPYEDRGRQRIEICLTGQSDIQRFEPLRRHQEQRRHVVPRVEYSSDLAS